MRATYYNPILDKRQRIGFYLRKATPSESSVPDSYTIVLERADVKRAVRTVTGLDAAMVAWDDLTRSVHIHTRLV